MPLVLPFPTVPTNGQALDATPLLANIQAITQAIQSFDGSQVQAGSIAAAALNASINPNTLLNETSTPFVRTGLVWSAISGLNAGMTGGTVYINGIRVPVNAVASNAFAASKDTYIDVDVNGNITYQAVANGAASPSLSANSIRIAIVISGATVTSVNQGSILATAPVVGAVTVTVNDTLGNLIYNTDPTGSVLGIRTITADAGTTGTTPAQINALSNPVIVPSTSTRIELILEGSAAYNLTGGGQCRLLIYDGAVGGTLLGEALHGAVGGAGTGVSGGEILRTTLDGASGLKTYNPAIKSNGANACAWEAGAYGTGPDKQPGRFIVKKA